MPSGFKNLFLYNRQNQSTIGQLSLCLVTHGPAMIKCKPMRFKIAAKGADEIGLNGKPESKRLSTPFYNLFATTAISFDCRSYGVPATSEYNCSILKPHSPNSISISSGVKYCSQL